MVKYTTLYGTLKQQIEEGTLKPGAKLPSEKDFMENHGVSRDTVRKALQLLVENGYIAKVKGKGSFVIETARFDFPVAGLISFKEMSQRMGFEGYVTHVLELSLGNASERIQRLLGVQQNAKVWRIHRVREVHGVRVILDKDYFLQDIVPHLDRQVCSESIYEYLEKDLGLKIGVAKKEIVMEWATEQDRKQLDLGEYAMVAVVNTLVYLQNGTLFQYTQSRHRPDKFRFVDVARRNPPVL